MSMCIYNKILGSEGSLGSVIFMLQKRELLQRGRGESCAPAAARGLQDCATRLGGEAGLRTALRYPDVTAQFPKQSIFL